MGKTITIPIEQIKCLREHLEAATEIFQRFGIAGSNASERKASGPIPRESKVSRINKYTDLITSGKRVTKPDHLKKKP